MNMLLHKAVNVCHPEAGHSATCRPADGTQAEAAAVNADYSTWSLDEEVSASGERSKVLSILLARPPLTEDEIKWKKGERLLI